MVQRAGLHQLAGDPTLYRLLAEVWIRRPEDLRGEDGQAKLVAFQAGLKNRPIPAQYANPNKSPVRVTVTKDQKEYKIELTR